MFMNRVLRRIFGPNEDVVQEAEEDHIVTTFITLTLHLILSV